MNTTTVTNPRTKRSYRVDEQIYETNRVWCGAGRDPELGELFVKLLRYDPQSDNANEIRAAARKEADTMERAARCTTGIPKLYDHWDDKKGNVYVLVMQKMPGRDLRKWLDKRMSSRPDEKTIRVRSLILKQVAQTLMDIHNKIPGISHLDLKPQNVMIWFDDQQKHWKTAIIDFGTAAMDYSVRVGTYGYQSPEQRSRQNTIMGSGESKDVFSLGMMWYELLTGIPAEDVYSEFERDRNNPGGEWKSRPSFPPEIQATDTGKRYNRMFEKMTAFDPDKRPTLRDVVHGISGGRKRR